MSGRPIPVELNQPLPRCVKATGSFKFLIAFLTLLPAMGVFMLGSLFEISHERAVLRSSGISVMGRITDLNVEHGKSTSYRVGYEFQPSSMRIDQHSLQAGHDYVSESLYRRLEIGKGVPILFEPARPEHSGLDLDGGVNISDDSRQVVLFAVFIVCLFGGIYTLFMALMLVPYYRRKKLHQWGQVAPAVIVKEKEITGRYPSMTATYEFTDNKGRTVTAMQEGLPSARRLGQPRFREAKDAVMKNPIALYDPENSEKSTLYRAGWLVCYLP